MAASPLNQQGARGYVAEQVKAEKAGGLATTLPALLASGGPQVDTHLFGFLRAHALARRQGFTYPCEHEVVVQVHGSGRSSPRASSAQ